MIERITVRDCGYEFGMTLANLVGWTSRGFCVSAMDSLAKEDVQMCRDALKTELGCHALITQRQTHGSHIQWVDQNSLCDNESDALVSSSRNTALCASVADCEGIVLYHPTEVLFAVVHSGWRGTALNISATVVEMMCKRGQVDASSLRAWCSPCASGRNYEVQADVQQLFPDYCVESSPNRFLFDNQRAVRDQLVKAGLLAMNIQYSELCTMEELSMYSYRRDKDKAGRMAVYICRTT